MRSFIVGILALALSACGSSQPDNQPDNAQRKMETLPAATVAATLDSLRKEQNVRDAIYQPTSVYQWVVAVNDNGSRRDGYAQYICLALADSGVGLVKTKVRIVDFSKYIRNGDARASELGAAECS